MIQFIKIKKVYTRKKRPVYSVKVASQHDDCQCVICRKMLYVNELALIIFSKPNPNEPKQIFGSEIIELRDLEHVTLIHVDCIKDILQGFIDL